MQTRTGERSGASPAAFSPFVADESSVREFIPKAVLLGAFFAVLFGAATVYLALRAGVTVSASIPIAVLAIAVFKRIGSIAMGVFGFLCWLLLRAARRKIAGLET